MKLLKRIAMIIGVVALVATFIFVSPQIASAHHDTSQVTYTCGTYQGSFSFYGGGEGGSPRTAKIYKDGKFVTSFYFDGKHDVQDFYTFSGMLPAKVTYTAKLFDGNSQVDTDTVYVNRKYTCKKGKPPVTPPDVPPFFCSAADSRLTADIGKVVTFTTSGITLDFENTHVVVSDQKGGKVDWTFYGSQYSWMAFAGHTITAQIVGGHKVVFTISIAGKCTYTITDGPQPVTVVAQHCDETWGVGFQRSGNNLVFNSGCDPLYTVTRKADGVVLTTKELPSGKSYVKGWSGTGLVLVTRQGDPKPQTVYINAGAGPVMYIGG